MCEKANQIQIGGITLANYHCAIRTNYFHVKDPELFRQFMARVYGAGGAVELWEKLDTNGQTTFAFGSNGGISGLRNAAEDTAETAGETAYDEFVCGLQQHVQENDAVIILESGREKLCYLVGTAEIITCTNCDHLDISDLAQRHAGVMLGNPAWQTKLDY